MNIDQYSILASVATLGLLILTLIVGGLFVFSKKIQSRILTLPYERFLQAIALVGLVSIVGAIIYQLVYETEVCELCWWQRVWMFPIEIIVPVALYYKSKISHVMVFILSILGMFVSAFHYYYHFQGYVLGNKLSLPCSVGGLLPSCTTSPILTFGFVTIPLMALISFFTIAVLALVAHKKFLQDSAQA